MTYNTRILIVDDNKSIHEDFKKVLCPEQSAEHEGLDELESELFGDSSESTVDMPMIQYEVDSAYQGEEALRMVEQAEKEGRPYALTFMDVRMPPGWDGVESISRIWIKFPYVEMVLCTAYSDYSWDEIVSKLGSTDKLLFIRKPFDAIAVQQMTLSLIKKWNLGHQARDYVSKLENEVQERTVQLRQLLKELEEKNQNLAATNEELKHDVLHDSLTNLPNRALFNDRLQHAIQIADREQNKFALMIVDVDKFKNINDTHGHLVGDAVLRNVGEYISSTLRKSDTVARIGGDEFALILPKINLEDLEQISQKLAAVFKKPMDARDAVLKVDVSIGISVYPDNTRVADELVQRADSAMYEAKNSGLDFKLYD